MAKFHHHLKNYFVPHEGNDHLPHALKPKRLLFHVSGAVAAKIVVVVFVCLFPLRAWMSPDLAAQESKKIIALTNDLRAGLKLPPLSENLKLDQAAADKVSDMLLNQYFAHVSPAGLNLETFLKKAGYAYAMAGENLAMGYDGAPAVVAAWEKSPTHYANLTDPNFRDIGVAMDPGRFKNVDTAFAAQYFGRPAQIPVAAVPMAVKNIQLPAGATTLAVKGPANGGDKVLRVALALPENTASAAAVVDNIKIDLAPQGQNNWQGSALISQAEENDISSPAVPASVKITDAGGAVSLAALDWSEITPVKTSAYGQYALLKSAPSSGMRAVLNFSDIYFWILLVLISAAMLNFIILKKQPHRRVLLAGAGSILVILALLVI
jgi:hypothetical protein